MSAKDKIIFGVLVVLIGVAGYFQYMATNMIARMDQLNKNDSEHVDVVHNEFREDLRILNLQFIGLVTVMARLSLMNLWPDWNTL